MLLSSARYWQVAIISGILLNLALNVSKSSASFKIPKNNSDASALMEASPDLTRLDTLIADNWLESKLSVIPEAVNLVKNFEGFRSSAYIDTSGLPVIGYGQTEVNGSTVTLGQYITQSQADTALEQELYHIQQLVLSHVKVDLNPYQLGALTSLVYNAGAVILKDSTLIRKLNAGDYIGAAEEFIRWNKANQGGNLVVYSGLTKRRLAEQKLFLAPYRPIASNN
jgi:lysozyme